MSHTDDGVCNYFYVERYNWQELNSKKSQDTFNVFPYNS